MPPSARRLTEADADAFQHLRMEGFRLQEREFRFAPEDEAKLGPEDVKARLARDFVVGIVADDALVGIGGVTRFTGVQVKHKALHGACI